MQMELVKTVEILASPCPHDTPDPCLVYQYISCEAVATTLRMHEKKDASQHIASVVATGENSPQIGI